MTNTPKPQLPIGYWLKRVDALLTTAIDQAQAEHGVSRTQWQVLNSIAQSDGTDKQNLADTLAEFADAQRIDAILAQFLARGWVTVGAASNQEPAPVHLSDEGRRHHAVILATQKEVRQRAMQGINEEEYTTVVGILQQIAANLDGGIR